MRQISLEPDFLIDDIERLATCFNLSCDYFVFPTNKVHVTIVGDVSLVNKYNKQLLQIKQYKERLKKYQNVKQAISKWKICW